MIPKGEHAEEERVAARYALPFPELLSRVLLLEKSSLPFLSRFSIALGTEIRS